MWLSLANFELCAQDQSEGDTERRDEAAAAAVETAATERARAVYREANLALRKADAKEQRVQLIEEWKHFEVLLPL